MALNTSKCNHLTPLYFKGLRAKVIRTVLCSIVLTQLRSHMHTDMTERDFAKTATNALVVIIKYSTKRTVLAWRGPYAPIAAPDYGHDNNN